VKQSVVFSNNVNDWQQLFALSVGLTIT